MERRSFADVKAHLSEVVDLAEHRGKRIVILRHGKPAAAIVPISAVRVPPTRAALSMAEANRRLAELTAELGGDQGFSAVVDLLDGRR